VSKVYIGIDNGVTGTIGVVGDDIQPQICHTPVKKEQNYTKKKDIVTRLDANGFADIIKQFDAKDVMIVMERPMVNPTRFKATTSALRCFEAQLILIEHLGLAYCYVDSKDWQRELLPKGIKGADEQKKASKDIGKRLFPRLADFKHPDFDGLLIAEYARRKNL
jgi:hypothetical protein